MLTGIIEMVTNPYLMPILLSFGLIGIAVELLIPGFGIPGIIGIVSFVLYFSGQFMAGFADPLHILLFVGGLLLLILEVFLPAFGIIGGLGMISIFSGIVLAAYDFKSGLISLGIAVVITTLVVLLVIRYFGHRGVWNRFILREQQRSELGYKTSKDHGNLLGKEGIALTPLRPAGIAVIEGRTVDVVSEGMFIERDRLIQVLEVQGGKVVVVEKIIEG